MATWPGERNGVKGTYLDGPFFPLFFPDTEEGRALLRQRIDTEIMFAKVLLGAFGIFCAGVFCFFVGTAWWLG